MGFHLNFLFYIALFCRAFQISFQMNEYIFSPTFTYLLYHQPKPFKKFKEHQLSSMIDGRRFLHSDKVTPNLQKLRHHVLNICSDEPCNYFFVGTDI